MAKKRVLFVSHQSKFIYGAETCVLELLKAAPAHFQAEFALPRGNYYDRLEPLVPVHAIASREFSRRPRFLVAGIIAWIKTAIQLRRLVRQREIDVVHAITLKSMVYAWPMRFCGVPVLWHHHDILPITRGNRFWTRCLGALASHIVVPSEATRDRLVKKGVPEAKVSVVYNGFSPEGWPGNGRGQREKEKLFTIGMIGEISYRKGSDRILSLVNDLSPRVGERVQLKVIGAGLSDPEFARQTIDENKVHIENGLLQFLGRREDVRALLAGIDVLILMSRQDPLPTVIIEAAFSQVPTIAFDVGGVTEMIEDGRSGWVVSSLFALAEQLVALEGKSDEVWKTGRAARKLAETKFSSTIMAQKMSLVYEAVSRPEQKS